MRSRPVRRSSWRAATTVTALVLRHLEPLSRGDLAKLRAFAAAMPACSGGCSPRGRTRSQLLDEGGPRAGLRAARVRHHHAVQADRLHAGQSAHQPRAGARARCACSTCSRDERVIDWFCGLGNFTLPIATRAREVLGIEGSETLVARSRENYERNRDARWPAALAPTEFAARNLFEMTPAQLVRRRRAPTAGWSIRRAKARSRWSRRWPTCTSSPSCAAAGRRRSASSTSAATRRRWRATPACWCTRRATAARAAGVVNMFPHTAHVESIAVFELAHAK